MIDDTLAGLYPAHKAALAAGYARVLAKHGLEGVYIHGGVAHARTRFDDQYWPLRPTPHLQHWAPVAEPDAGLVVRADGTATLLRVPVTSFWEHPFEPAGRHWEPHLAQRSVARFADQREHLPAGRVAFVGDDLAAAGTLGLEMVNPVDLLADLDALRVKKTGYERAALAEANRRAAPGHAAVRDAFAAGAESELDLHLAYLRATAQDDPETPYKNIVALGAHAATLHHVSYARGGAKGQRAGSLLLDAGACAAGYCSDITRTWVRDAEGATASAFASLVAGLETLQQTLCAEVRVGMRYEALHDRSHALLGALLASSGVVRCSAEEAVAAGLTRAFYPHGLGHSLGLQCHDVGCAVVKPRADNPFLRNTSVIEAGQVFTIEPGVYFIAGLLDPLRAAEAGRHVDWALVDALAPFGGIRIEDDLVVTDDPARPVDNLTRPHLPVGGAVV